MNVEEKVKEVLEILLEHKIGTEEVSSASEELWDSLKHLEIIVTLEEELEIKFNQESISNLNSMSKIIEEVKKIKQQ